MQMAEHSREGRAWLKVLQGLQCELCGVRAGDEPSRPYNSTGHRPALAIGHPQQEELLVAKELSMLFGHVAANEPLTCTWQCFSHWSGRLLMQGARILLQRGSDTLLFHALRIDPGCTLHHLFIFVENWHWCHGGHRRHSSRSSKP